MNPLNGRDFYEWPEWRALCARLGINLELDCITKIVISAPVLGFVTLEITRHINVPADAAARLAKWSVKYMREDTLLGAQPPEKPNP